MDTNSIDIIGVRKDGGLELIIVLDKMIDDLPDEQTQLLDKMENYMAYADSDSFKKDFPQIAKGKVTIKLTMPEKPSDRFSEWLQSIETWITENGFRFIASVSKKYEKE